MRTTLNDLTYPQFAATIGNNTPPGALDTVKWWIEKSLISDISSVLDLACCHGYSTFNIHIFTRATIHGVDIEPLCIETAKAQNFSKDITFSVGDAENLYLGTGIFSHVVSGCSLGFVKNLNSALSEAFRVLTDSGKLCCSNFYYKSQPSAALLNQVKEVLGFIPNSNFENDFQKGIKKRFHLSNSEKFSLLVFPQEILKQVVKGFVENQMQKCSQAERNQAFERMYYTRSVLNDLRRHQYYQNEIWNKI